jgi:hypothetical protein
VCRTFEMTRVFFMGVILLGSTEDMYSTFVERVEAVMSHRIQPPAKFRGILMFGAFRDAFNCLDCV